MEDIRWQQRFENYKKAVNRLHSAIEQYGNTDIAIIKEGIIQRFEFTHELSWKLMQDILKGQGETDLFGSKSATRLAFNRGLIQNGEIWLDMIESRNITVHTYNSDILDKEFNKVVKYYLPLFIQFQNRIEQLWQSLD